MGGDATIGARPFSRCANGTYSARTRSCNQLNDLRRRLRYDALSESIARSFEAAWGKYFLAVQSSLLITQDTADSHVLKLSTRLSRRVHSDPFRSLLNVPVARRASDQN